MGNKLTFFSGTDTGTLLSEGSDMNHFVSLIVNNAGVYTAGITRRLSVNQKVSEEFSYPSWNDTTKTGTREFVASKTYVQWFNLKVFIEGVQYDETEILDRIKEIRKIKSEKAATKFPVATGTPKPVIATNPTKEYPNEYSGFGTLFDKDDEDGDDLFEIPYDKYHFSDELVTQTVKQMITLSLIIPNDKVIKPEEWAKNMVSLFDKRFINVEEFESVATNIVDFLINSVDEEESYLHLTPRQCVSVFANDVKNALSKLPENKYINSLISICDEYVL